MAVIRSVLRERDATGSVVGVGMILRKLRISASPRELHFQVRNTKLVLLPKKFRSGMLSKGGGKHKTAPGDWSGLVAGQKEPWNSSGEKAKDLKILDFGTPEEVREMAKPIRTAVNRQDATKILKYLAEKGPLANKKGMTATLSCDSRGKIVSNKALRTSYGQKAHYMAVANIDKLFSNAIEPWEFELNPHKNNDGLSVRHYLYAPLEFDGKLIPVKITVKEYKDTALRMRLYSVEAIDAELG